VGVECGELEEWKRWMGVFMRQRGGRGTERRVIERMRSTGIVHVGIGKAITVRAQQQKNPHTHTHKKKIQ
jgi:hypothetical protein